MARGAVLRLSLLLLLYWRCAADENNQNQPQQFDPDKVVLLGGEPESGDHRRPPAAAAERSDATAAEEEEEEEDGEQEHEETLEEYVLRAYDEALDRRAAEAQLEEEEYDEENLIRHGSPEAEKYWDAVTGGDDPDRGGESADRPPADEGGTPEAAALFAQAEDLLEKAANAGGNAVLTQRAYRLIDDSAATGYRPAVELASFAYLFGDHMPWNVQRAKEMFELLADAGSPTGQFGLAFVHMTAMGVEHTSQATALVHLTFAALGGSDLAQIALAYRYYAGVGVPANCESALAWYRSAAAKVADEVKFTGGNVIQRVRLNEETEAAAGSASVAVSNSMDENLLQYYRFLADKGDVQAQVGIGQLYLGGGRGVQQNYHHALHYFQMAAEQGSANAHAYLGKMYLDGTAATPQSNQTAYQYFTRAAEKGNPVGQSGLGVMHLYGRGVKKDYSKALRLFTLSAEQGWVDGQLNLGHMYFNGLGAARDFKLAVKYLQLASQAGHVLAYYNLAQMHATGVGAQRSCHTAVELYKNVAERGRVAKRLMEAHAAYKDGFVAQAAIKYLFLAELGFEVAQTNIAYLLDKGAVKHDLFGAADRLPMALQHWSRAAVQGYGHARVVQGDYYYYGLGTQVDYETAAQHYKLAAEQQNSAQAMFNLGYMHERGLGIKRDMHLAKRFYDMAAETSSEAYVPVMLALAKLSFVFAWHYFTEQPMWTLKFIDYYLGSNWDLYLTAFLCAMLAVLAYLRLR